MKKINHLHYNALRPQLDTRTLQFKTTDELKITQDFIVQKRALIAIQFGIGIQKKGYNLYAMGPVGIGKRSLVKSILKEKAKKKEVPADWCYIHNFEDPAKPLAIQLPAGKGLVFKDDVHTFINSLSINLLSVFESDEYRRSLSDIQQAFKKSQEHYSKKQDIEKNIKLIHLYKKKLIDIYKKKHRREKNLQLKLTAKVVKPLVKKLKSKYAVYPHVLKFLRLLERDIILNVNDLIRKDESTHIFSFIQESAVLMNYQVNLLVDNGKKHSAPVVIEENPTYTHLICRVEYTPKMGTAATHFTLIKPGSLHIANGGYLIMSVEKLLKDKHAWNALKRALKTKKISIDPVEPTSDMFRPVSLEPTPIPLNVKIVLLGSRQTYYQLCDEDPEFNDLFKIAVDFDETIIRNNRNIQLFARLIKTIAHKENLRAFSADAVAELIDHSSRLAEDNKKLSADVQTIHDIAIEADYCASIKKNRTISAVDIKNAIKAQVQRINRSQQLYDEDILNNIIHINTRQRIIGQVNGLSVVKVGRYIYGHPIRVTATVRRGKTKIIDIQREIKMAGPIHTKAGITIINFLGERYNRDHLLRLYASISFEQVYAMVDGDSASVAEVCALISALAEVPIKQFLAVTGSIDQYGMVQAVGGINQKIEGFYNICKHKGLNGTQGVIIPAVNVKNLMLHEEIVNAAKSNKFFIYPIHTIDEAMTLLTDIPAGQKKAGQFEAGSLNEKVDKKLKYFSLHYPKNLD